MITFGSPRIASSGAGGSEGGCTDASGATLAARFGDTTATVFAALPGVQRAVPAGASGARLAPRPDDPSLREELSFLR